MKTITVVSPVFNEAEVIETFYARLTQELRKVRSYRYKILFVLDRSADGTLGILKRIAGRDHRVQVLSLSSRFGHQASLLAGLDHAQADAVIMMDCDLQHPPELIHEMIAKYEKGNDIVFAIRRDTHEIGLLKRMGSKLFYRFINSITDVPINENAADFRLISRKVLKVFQNQVRERNLFLRGLISWVGFNQVSVNFTVQKRHSGKSKYSFTRLFRLAWAGVLSFSKKPLQAAIFVGVLFALFAFINGAITFVQYFIDRSLPSGWATIVILLSGLGGIQLIFLGILGEYIGGIFDEVKARPHYLVDEKVNLSR